MYKNRKNLFVIDEDYLNSNDKKYTNEKNNQTNFLDLVKLNRLKKNHLNEQNHTNQNGRLLFLDKQSELISFNKKSTEYDKYISDHAKSVHSDEIRKNNYDLVKEKLNKNRNPNVYNLIKDIRSQSCLSQLQDSLKSEFNLFINESVNDSVENVKRFSALENHENLLNKSGIFLTEEADEEVSKIFKNDKKNKKTETKEIEIEQKLDKINNNDKKELVQANMEIAVINEQNEQESTSLNKLKKMLDHIRLVDIPKFQTELHQVCQYGADTKLLDYVSQGNEVDLIEKQNGLGRYCIHECCITGNIEMLKAILPFVENINCLDQNGQNAAHVAAKFGELECLKLLIANGIDIEKRDNLGLQLSHLAAAYNRTNIIQFWFDLGYSFNLKCSKGKLPIHYACEQGSFEALKLMCEFYVDLSLPDEEGNTPAHLAAKNDKLNCLKYLVRLGIPVNKVSNNLGRNVVHEACFHGSFKCLHWLFDEIDIDLNAVDKSGNTLAHICCLGGRAECLNCCIQHNVKIYCLNYDKNSPLDVAKKVGKRNHMEKAIKNEITCEYCVKDALRIKFEKENEKTIAEKTIEKNINKMYNLNELRNFKQENIVDRQKSTDDLLNTKRDLVAQFFGPDV